MVLGNNPTAEEKIGRSHAATGRVAECPSMITNIVPVPNLVYHILIVSSSVAV